VKHDNDIASVDIEIAVAKLFDSRRNLIVPNVSWGLGIHECDLLIVTKNNYAYEVEIKISKADILQDRKKTHAHNSKKIKFLYFAIPKHLLSCIDLIPERAGIIIADRDKYDTCFASFLPNRTVKANPDARPLTDQERLKVAELGCMRIFDLKRANVNLYNQYAISPLLPGQHNHDT